MAKKMDILSKKNVYLVVGLVSILIVLWTIMYAVPSLFVGLFSTFLGNMILLGLILLIAMFNKTIAIGISILFVILYQFAHMTASKIINK
jgi:hypothetical protein